MTIVLRYNYDYLRAYYQLSQLLLFESPGYLLYLTSRTPFVVYLPGSWMMYHKLYCKSKFMDCHCCFRLLSDSEMRRMVAVGWLKDGIVPPM
jgi:hypothetical protein